MKYKGKQLTLNENAYIAGTRENIIYLATATDEDGQQYEIEWAINEETQKAYDEIERQRELGETPNYSLVEDESNACDWDNPIEIRKV